MKHLNKVEKKYALNNSYFKNRKSEYPDTLLEIVQYWKEFDQLPFEYIGKNWIYDAMCERQKKLGIINSQYLTPDKTAKQIAEMTNNFVPKDSKVLDACCGTGQLTKYLIESGLKVTGFDIDEQMVEICKLLYPTGTFSTYDFNQDNNLGKWDLIVANPPYEQKEIVSFLEWLSLALNKDGKAILLIPKDFLAKDKPKKLVEMISRFEVLHQEEMTETFFHTSWKSDIHILGLSEKFKTKDTVNKLPEESEAISLNPEVTEKKIDNDKIQLINLESITVSCFNPRKKIDEDEIMELATSIKEIGLLHPIILRPKNEKYEIVCGERRFSAFYANNATQIPAIIKYYSDEQVRIMAVAENLIRKNLSPMEEAHAFQTLIDLRAYNLEELIAKFGKSEFYIRSRLRLLNLILDFSLLLDNDELSIGAGIELSKYTKELQSDIFSEHFQNEDNSSWKSVGTKELAGRINRIYTCDLTNYSFDKKECRNCPFNTESYSLFSESGDGRCTNRQCLEKKKSDFTHSFCKTLSDNNSISAVCISHYDKLLDDTAEKLKQEGIEIKIITRKECPEIPVKPQRSSFSTDKEYNEALDEYKLEEVGYMAEIDDLNKKTEKGLYERVVYIGENNPTICFVPIEQDNRTDPIEELKRQEKKCKETAMMNIYKSTCDFLKTVETPSNELSEFEYSIFLFAMLGYLNKSNFKHFGVIDSQKNALTFEEKDQIIKHITPEQHAILQREFIIKHLSGISDVSAKSIFFLPQYAMQHFPNEVGEITKKHMDVYNKSKLKIEQKMKKIEGEGEKEEYANLSN